MKKLLYLGVLVALAGGISWPGGRSTPQTNDPILIGAGDIVVTVGGIVPQQDHAFLEAAGVRAIFGPGTKIPDAARRVLDLLGASGAADAAIGA